MTETKIAPEESNGEKMNGAVAQNGAASGPDDVKPDVKDDVAAKRDLENSDEDDDDDDKSAIGKSFNFKENAEFFSQYIFVSILYCVKFICWLNYNCNIPPYTFLNGFRSKKSLFRHQNNLNPHCCYLGSGNDNFS